MASGLPSTAAAQPVADGPFSFGMQTGLDVVFEDPVFMVQTGPVAHVRFDAEHSMRLFVGYAYARNLEPQPLSTEEAPPLVTPDGTVVSTTSTGPTWRDRHMFSLRLSEGYSFDPVVEGRLFGELRFVAARADAVPPASVDVATPAGTIPIDDGRPERWLTDWSLGGGTEWIVRPEASRRLELGVSLGAAAVATDTYDPAGNPRTSWSPRVYGGVCVGRLFF